ncbi:MAG: hypothetical protein IJV06_09380 [Bacteroidaceae bacterium]|nr:hypothetical protein [Bacteroidaceae bacterium]
MKKTYQKPEIFVEKILVESMIAQSPLGTSSTAAQQSAGMDSKYRGDYEPENEPTFGDLW